MIGMIGIMGVGALIVGIVGIVVSIGVGASQAVAAKELATKQDAAQKEQNNIAAKARRTESNNEERTRRSTLNQASYGNAIARWKTRKMRSQSREWNRDAAMMNANVKATSWARNSHFNGNPV